MSDTHVVLLGTGTPNADPDRMGPSLAIVVDEKPYIVDFGPGIVRRAAAAERDGISALAAKNLQTAFLTHLHSDHTTGYADLIFSPWVLGREKPLEVYGPPGLTDMTRHILAAYAMDRKSRVCGFEPINPDAYGALSHEIEPGLAYEDDHVKVEAFGVDHGEGWLALGYQFTTADRRIVISGDTAPMDSLIELWKGCDVLVHEVYSQKAYLNRSPEWQHYHAHMHTSTKQLADIANQVQPKKLVLTHLLLWGTSEAELVAEIKETYSGEVICGEDLGVY
ncbi:MAG: MBL fold metallo-hydrolase [Proteobacteria bacterium]|nr:MBL fold metallo-hydrolase [Pseudomonadota bacterium]